jgi:DNA repair protein RecN (Recombination protein N)
MLETLKIRNLAVIDAAEIPFKPGLNILSGETGAGKSIVIEAISLLLGSRASSSLIRTGCEEAVVEGVFDLASLPEIRQRLSELGLNPGEDGQLLIKRTVHHAGRHRISINGELATLGNLQSLCVGLVDLCSQHEHQSLLKTSTQIELLDRYGKLEETRARYRESFEKVRNLKLESERLSQNESARLKRLDFLRFQIEELRAANLQPGEETGLQQEKTLLQSAQGRLQSLDQLRGLLEDGEDGNVLQLLQLAIQKTGDLSQLDERVRPLQESLERALAEVEDTSLSLHRYSKSVDLDPDRLEQVLERLSLLADLRRKYGEDTRQMLEMLTRLENEFEELSRNEERIEEIQGLLEIESTQLRAIAAKLSQGRSKASTRLAAAVTAELRELNMADAEFLIPLTPAGDDLEKYTPLGADEIDFMVRTNRGETAHPMGKIASGGELSRILLSIRRLISDRGGIGVYLFDEIDAGMGGHTAFQVGRKLKAVSSHNQVLCITHLPQVASFGDHHLVVRKSAQGKRTITEVLELGKKDRKEELARMLGGALLTKKSLENAAELLEMAAG